ARDAAVIVAVARLRKLEVEHLAGGIDVELGDELEAAHAGWWRKRGQEELDGYRRINRLHAATGSRYDSTAPYGSDAYTDATLGTRAVTRRTIAAGPARRPGRVGGSGR